MHKVIGALILGFLATSGIGAEENPRQQAIDIVTRIQRADYEGDRVSLKACYEALTPLVANYELASRIRYWRGFARWRDGINSGNESVDPIEMEKLFMAGVDEFKAALALDPTFVDAKIGVISCLGHIVYLHRNEKERAQELVKQIYPVIDEAKAAAPDNPRLLWVLGPVLFYTPPEKGGGVPKVIENYERGLTICSHLKPPADKLEPSWGEPELLMSVAYTYMTKNPPDLDKAEKNARAALEIVPHWHYAGDILLPQILEAKAKASAK